MVKKYKISVDCANCANKMLQAVSKMPEVKNCNIAFMTQRMSVEFEDISEEELKKKIYKTCKKIDDDFEFV